MAQPTPVSDWYAYRQLAADLIDHRQFGYPNPTSDYLPVFPVYVAVWTVFSRAEIWLGLSSVVLSTVSVWLIYAIGLRVYVQQRTALIAAGLFAFLPIFVIFSPVLASEHLLVVLLLLAMLLLLNMGARGGVTAALVGVLAGLATLTRGEGVAYIPAIIIFVWFGSTLLNTRERLRATALVVVGVLVVAAPWHVRNLLITAPDPGLSESAGINFYFAHNDSGIYGWHMEGSPLEGLNPETANRLGWELGFSYLRENPANLLWDIGYGTVELIKTPDYALFWSTRGLEPGGDPIEPDSFFEKPVRLKRAIEAALAIPVLLVLAVAALLAYRTWTRRLVWLVVPLMAASWFLRTAVYWAKPRYGYFISVLLVFIAALALAAIIDTNQRVADSVTE